MGQKEAIPSAKAEWPRRVDPGPISLTRCRVLGTSCFFGKRSLATRLCLLLHQRPDAIPLGGWGGDAELRDAFQE
jgi:hypothetical protein